MLRQLRIWFWWFVRGLLRLRYHVEVTGLEQLRGVEGPTLVMPNHPAYCDPLLVLTNVCLGRAVRPVVYEGMYRLPILYPFMKLVQALEVPDLAEHSRDARQQTLAMIDAVVAEVQRGESFLIYPSGRAQRSGLEKLGAARAASEILQRCPEAHVVLVRTRGLWGSSLSYARTGHAPNLIKSALQGIGWTLANLLFLAPKRHVKMTVELVQRKDLPGLDRESLNRGLETWYNQGDRETPTFVPYHPFLGPQEYNFPDLVSRGEIDLENLKPETIQAANEMLEEHLKRPLSEAEKQAETPLDQIGMDSLDRMDIALAIEDRFGFRSEHVPETVGELWVLAHGQTGEESEEETPVPALWDRLPSNNRAVEILAETIPAAVVRQALLNLDDVAVADEVSGVLTYRRLLIGTQLLSRRLGRLAGNTVGVMLPASVAADLVFLSLHTAGKLPAMLNWTTGPANLAHAVRKHGIRHVVTSRKLIDRLGIQVEGAEYLFLEDLKKEMGKLEALVALVSSYLMPSGFLRRLPKAQPDDPAVILFTSGSESAPKAVPLTHRNLLTNVLGSLEVIEATRKDRLLACLPPFHSFGLMAGMITPLVAGVRAVHHPDPTAATALVRVIARYRATLTVTTPTFLGFMFASATAEDLRSLRLVITGAEKCPDAIFARGKELMPGAIILEGYGITECSPVVAGNRPAKTKLGTVGPPIRGVEVTVVDPESHSPMPRGETGLLLVHGPTVFHGYLEYEGPDPFVEFLGKRWYNTGDLVSQDEDGYIHFRGRLKRFLKAAGEMISLPALEEPLSRRYPVTENGPQVAVEGVETPTGRKIVLFAVPDLSLREANAILSDAGFRGVMRLDEVVRMDAIPMLGTGKTDYKVLRKMVAQSVPAVM